MKTKTVSVGDVFQIPLPDGTFAYGRVYKDASVGIYRAITDEPNQPPIGSRDFWFIVGLYINVLEGGTWPIIGRDDFGASESAWPPPMYVKDIITGNYQIYDHGQLHDAVEREVIGLEEAAVWDADHIVRRIMRDVAPNEVGGDRPF